MIEIKKLHIKTANNYIAYIRKLFNYAIKIEAIKNNPFNLVTSFKVTKEEMSPKDNFTIDELKKILSTDKKDLRNFMIFALHTGLRLGEIWSLDSSSVDIRDGIKYIKVKTLKQKYGVIKYREIPIHKNIEHLSDLLWLKKIKKGKADYNYFGKRLNKHIHSIIVNSNVSFHRLRGNFTSFIKNYALENGMADITPILLGHSTDLATDIYAKGVSLKAKLLSLQGLDFLEEII